jgi:hypothetical protein
MMGERFFFRDDFFYRYRDCRDRKGYRSSTISCIVNINWTGMQQLVKGQRVAIFIWTRSEKKLSGHVIVCNRNPQKNQP